METNSGSGLALNEAVKAAKVKYIAFLRRDDIWTNNKLKVQLDCMKLNFNHKEYVTLLVVSDLLITMSKFLEGWNRTVYVAILVGTPVVGSGKGGMLELLEKSSQKVVTNFSDLNEIVSKVLNEESKNIEHTLIFVSRLDLNYLRKSWSAVFKDFIL